MNSANGKTAGIIFVICLIVLLAGVLVYKSRQESVTPIVYSPKAMMDAVWQQYKANYLEVGSQRTLDRQRGGITTSEGQSYTMLRAVWMDDKPVFDSAWNWTQNNLKQPKSNLFSWLYGQRADDKLGILTEQKGQNSASDADVDIALALAFAYSRWQRPEYLTSARAILNDIWNKEVVMVASKPYLAANDVEKNNPSEIIMNPSYLAPYAFRIFADIDPNHDWLALVDTSYSVIEESMRSSLDKEVSASLPPNWIAIDRATGNVKPVTKQAGLDTDYGYDALRVPWRIAIDWQWNAEPRAKKVLESFPKLEQDWQSKMALYSIYSHDGKPLAKEEASSMYGGSIGSFMVMNPNQAGQVYKNKLVSLYNPDTNSWKVTLNYYDDNWTWFGTALYLGALPNLWSGLNSQ